MCEYYNDCNHCANYEECMQDNEYLEFSGMYPECEGFRCVEKCHPSRECITYEDEYFMYHDL